MADGVPTLSCRKCNTETTTASSLANGKNPLLRNCLDCVATDKWLLRICRKEADIESDVQRERREKGEATKKKPQGDGRAAKAGMVSRAEGQPTTRTERHQKKLCKCGRLRDRGEPKLNRDPPKHSNPELEAQHQNQIPFIIGRKVVT